MMNLYEGYYLNEGGSNAICEGGPKASELGELQKQAPRQH